VENKNPIASCEELLTDAELGQVSGSSSHLFNVYFCPKQADVYIGGCPDNVGGGLAAAVIRGAKQATAK
jgi:hypothetical protein